VLEVLLPIAPIFVLIVLGHLLRRGNIPSLEFWNLNDRLVYWVLFPALLFYKTSTLKFSGGLVVPYAVVIYGGFACAVLFALLGSRLLRFEGPLASSLVQGCARHNTFIALAVAERLYGAQGLAVAALTTALLIPLTNVTVVTLMVTLVRGGSTGGAGEGVSRAIARDLMRNPLLIAVLAGIGVNLGGVGHMPVLHDVAQILGDAALPVMLLCVGANIRVRAMAASALPTTLSLLGKMVVFPGAVVMLATLTQLPAAAALVALVYGAVPTAPSGFTLARQMGGDAPVMAAMITVQTVVAFLTLPLTLTLAARLLSP
jgi:predicted permease